MSKPKSHANCKTSLEALFERPCLPAPSGLRPACSLRHRYFRNRILAKVAAALPSLGLAHLALALALFLSACLFDAEAPTPRPTTDFDLSRLAQAPNPLAMVLRIEAGQSWVGLQFAFQSLDYAHEVDTNIEAYRKETGRLPALVGAYFDLSSQPHRLRAFLAAVRSHDCIPYVTLDPKDWDESDLAYQKTFVRLIQEGYFDATLESFAATLAEFQEPILLRFGHEMNGNWYPYAGGGDGDGDGNPDGPTAFIEAWRHVHDLFARKGAAQVLWVFCPGAEDFPKTEWNRPFQYYPGNDYVDLVFVDAYEHFEKGSSTLENRLEYFLNEYGLFLEGQWAAGDSAIRPLGLGEFGTNRTMVSAKAQWYSQALQTLADDKRIQFHFLYNARDGRDDFSITGLGPDLQRAFSSPHFRFGPVSSAVQGFAHGKYYGIHQGI